MTKTALILTFFFTAISFGFATIRYVKPTATGAGDGSSWVNASANLNSILNASTAGDQIWVAAGTYKPAAYPRNCPSCSGVRDYSFHLQGGVKMYGGFAGTETMLSQRNISQNVTILSGDIGLTDATDDNVYHVVIYTSSIAGSELDGFTVTKGGTIAYLENSQNEIDGKFIARINGGGGFISGQNLTIRNCIFTSNSTYSGAGMVVESSEGMTIEFCRFENNTSNGGFGGGINLILFQGVVRNSSFLNNSGSGGGGMAIFSNDIQSATLFPTVYNCLFTGNNSITEGSAILLYGLISSTSITNCTVVSNNSGQPGAIHVRDGATGIFRNNIVWGNTFNSGGNFGFTQESASYASTISHSLIQGGLASCISCPGGSGNVDPQFNNLAKLQGFDMLPGTFDDGLSLRHTSPAINSGDNTVSSVTDILGRTKSGIKDIGAFEFIPKGNCIDNRHAGAIPIEAGTHLSLNNFTSDGSVAAGSDVVLTASRQVLLLPGFETQSNAVFRTVLASCP